MKKHFMRFLRDDNGLTAVEYAIAGALISLALVVSFEVLGDNAATQISNLANAAKGTP